MKFWFDTEFQDDGRTIDLISIAVVAEDGREYYAVSEEYRHQRASLWLQENVLKNLADAPSYSRLQIRNDLQKFFSFKTHSCDDISTPEFWAYCGEYDWIVLRQLFGDLMAWPVGWPLFAMDIEQWRVQLRAPAFRPQGLGQHNALADARYTRECWQELVKYSISRK
ncbi:3'-5' exoribonuclease domain-containing protein [Propionivibrio sp.]|uniref:3'-5' exoribonuclease domain-containing protein n=1 Tax=Propionivibrio sp. TaxID=2212460 RepID=UPI003BEFC4FC